ncbi:MAG: hypothetical protein AAFN94_00580 [Pseudomonadota bacterium]
MLTCLLATHDEGSAFDLFLRALADAIGPADSLLVFHSGDAQTLARLQGFAETHATRIIQIDQPVAGHGDLLRLGMRMVEQGYVLALDPTDRLQAEAMATLRTQLNRDAPDLALVHSGWWLADAGHPLPRSDSAMFATLPVQPNQAACAALLPDPRRLVWRAPDWADRVAHWPQDLEGKALYARALADSTQRSAVRAPMLLHRMDPVDPAPVLAACIADLETRAKAARTAALADWAPLLDEHLSLCPPAAAATILDTLPRIAALLPRQARRHMGQQKGSFARLLHARITDGALGAKAELGLGLAAHQHHRSDLLAHAYDRLRRDVDLALPGPDYLQALYTRLRGP